MRNNLDSLAARDQHSKSALAAQSGIYLRGLPEQITEDTLRAIFSTHAPVVNVEIMSCLDHGKKVAFVNLSNEAAAEQVSSGAEQSSRPSPLSCGDAPQCWVTEEV